MQRAAAAAAPARRPVRPAYPRGTALLATALLAAALLMGLAGCGKPAPAPPAAPPPPDDAYARAERFVYEGGVGQGRRRGRTVHRDGHVEFWESDPEKEGGARVVRERQRVGPAAVATIFAAAREVDFLGVEQLDEAEFGFSMELLGPDGTHRVAWAKAKQAPPQLRPIYNAFALLGSGRR